MVMELLYGIEIEDLTGNLFYVLVIWIVFDIITGLLRAMRDRRINSSVNFEGLVRKAGEIVGVIFLTFVDSYLNTNGLLTKIGVGALIVYETISIVENFKQIGVDVGVVMKYFDKEKYKNGVKNDE